ncbi:hypothetical protein ACHAXS_002959 [Conticribra weissflogii]
MESYKKVGLPGCGGSIDVVHVKWSNCPAGDFNRCKGKESFPLLAREVISGFNQEILGMSSVQFSTRNDKHIDKLDDNVAGIRDVEWDYYDKHSNHKTSVGIYLVCDSGYLRWPILICPYKHAKCTSPEVFFSDNLESVWKDVECVFGILKKRCCILDFGIHFCDIKIGNKIFVVCCILHNMMSSKMECESNPSRASQELLEDASGMWLEGETVAPPISTSTDKI